MLPHFIDLVEDQPPDVLEREHRNILKDSYEALAETWFEQLLPDHFQSYSGAKYGYQRRSRRYEERKQALARVGVAADGGKTDLVLTGNSRDVMTRSVRIRASKDDASATVETPFYFPLRRNLSAPDKAAEVLVVLTPQQQMLEEIGGRVYEERLQNVRETRKTKIKP